MNEKTYHVEVCSHWSTYEEDIIEVAKNKDIDISEFDDWDFIRVQNLVEDMCAGEVQSKYIEEYILLAKKEKKEQREKEEFENTFRWM